MATIDLSVNHMNINTIMNGEDSSDEEQKDEPVQ